jgi:hypothetical protein
MHRNMSPRRIRWAMRALVYGPLALIALVVLGMPEPERLPPTTFHDLTGTTAHGSAFELHLEPRTGAVVFARTQLILQCSTGGQHVLDLWRSDDDDAVFTREGDRLGMRARWSEYDQSSIQEGWVAIDGRSLGDRAADGVVTAEIAWRSGAVLVRSCWARRVPWRVAEE